MTNEQRGTPEPRYGWLMVVVTAVLNGAGIGGLTSMAVFLTPLSEEFGWLRGNTAFAYTVGAASMGLSGIFMGYLSDRFSTRPIVLFGTLSLSASFLLLSTQSAIWQLYLFYSLLGGFGAAALFTPLIANVGFWFTRNKGLALGVATAGQAFGQALVPFLARYLITVSGWRGAYIILGLAFLAILVPLAFFVRNPPGHAEAKAAAQAGGTTQDGETPLLATGIVVTWLSVASIFCCITMATALIHVAALAQDLGFSPQQAAGVFSLIGLGAIFGRIGYGKLADSLGGVRTYLIASLVQTVLIFWYTQLDSLDALYAMSICFGLGYSGVMTCLSICARELTPVHLRGVSFGIVALFGWIGMGLGGFQGGFFYDLSGSYTLPFANAVGSGVINLIIVAAFLYYVSGKQRLAVVLAA